MYTTSHFVGIELKSEYFSDIFVRVYQYLKENKVQDCISFQNPLSPHVTIYYFEQNLDDSTKIEIKKSIEHFAINKSIKLAGFDYFYRGEGNRQVLYFTSDTDLPLQDFRDELHNIYKRNEVEDNNFSFSPHITFLRIQNRVVFEVHRENIEKIIEIELQKLKNIDINVQKVYLYAVNSTFKEEIQLKLL